MKNIIQPNQVTNARYDFTSVQKNILYQIIERLQPLMTKEEIKLEEQQFTFKLKEIDPNRNYQRIIQEVKKLYSKPIEYTFTPKNGRKTEVLSTVIGSVIHEENSEEVTFIVPSYAMPFFCYYGAIGFTSLQKTIAISLRSTYSKRIYELCCRWKDKGGFVMPISELRSILMLENKYKLIGHFKSRILNTAQKELKEKADLWFEYDLKKVNSRSYNIISFKIHQNSIEAIKHGNKGQQGEQYSFVWRFLQHAFPMNNSDKANMIADQITSNGQLDIAYNRFVRLDDELTQGKKERVDIIRITKHFLKEDLNIN